jgi:hypothetical protein
MPAAESVEPLAVLPDCRQCRRRRQSRPNRLGTSRLCARPGQRAAVATSTSDDDAPGGCAAAQRLWWRLPHLLQRRPARRRQSSGVSGRSPREPVANLPERHVHRTRAMTIAPSRRFVSVLPGPSRSVAPSRRGWRRRRGSRPRIKVQGRARHCLRCWTASIGGGGPQDRRYRQHTHADTGAGATP